MNRADALELYRSLPLPDTSMEAWRFTDLRGFDPDAFAENGRVEGTVPGTVPGTVTESVPDMLEIDVAGLATAAREARSRSTSCPTASSSPHCRKTTSAWGPSSAPTTSSRRTTLLPGSSGLLVRVPKGVELDDPLYVRVVGDDTGATFWRLLVVAEEGSRFSLIEEFTSPSAEAAGYYEQLPSSCSSSRARSSSTCRCRTSPGTHGTSPPIAPR